MRWLLLVLLLAGCAAPTYRESPVSLSNMMRCLAMGTDKSLADPGCPTDKDFNGSTPLSAVPSQGPTRVRIVP